MHLYLSNFQRTFFQIRFIPILMTELQMTRAESCWKKKLLREYIESSCLVNISISKEILHSKEEFFRKEKNKHESRLTYI